MRRNFMIKNNSGDFSKHLNISNSEPIRLKLNKIGQNIDIRIDTSTAATSQDVYYDEIVYYDGGGVDGYGD